MDKEAARLKKQRDACRKTRQKQADERKILEAQVATLRIEARRMRIVGELREKEIKEIARGFESERKWFMVRIRELEGESGDAQKR